MSMLCSLYRMTPEQVAQLRQFPASIGELFGLDAPAPPPSLLAKIFGKAPPKAAERRFAPIAAGNTFEVEGAWHILHFLFSGRGDEGPWPAAFLLCGGVETGPDHGYGPARLVDAEQVEELAAFLAAQRYEALHAAYASDAIEATEIHWQTAATPEERRRQLDGLWDVVTGLREFVRRAASAGDSVIACIY